MLSTPPLKSLYRRELLAAPKPAFAIAGCPGVHRDLAEGVRDKLKVTRSVPTLMEAHVLTEFQTPSVQGEQKSYLREDTFSFYQRCKPAVILALVDISMLQSGNVAWTQCLERIQKAHTVCTEAGVKLMVSVVAPKTPEKVVLAELASILNRDFHLEERLLLSISHQPTPSEIEAVLRGLIYLADRSYEQWQVKAYKTIQQMDSGHPEQQASAARHSIKAAHFLELSKQWHMARTRYQEAYRLMVRTASPALSRLDAASLRPLLMAADWTNLKLLLYAIGSGDVTMAHMKTVHSQWLQHKIVFFGRIEGAHCVVQSWHYSWVARQHQVMLAILLLYCSHIRDQDLPVELHTDVLLDGVLAALSGRQDLAEKVKAAEFGVVLDTSTVQDGTWLGTWVQKLGDKQRALTALETMAYMMTQEGAVQHTGPLIAVLADCIAHSPLPDASASSAVLRAGNTKRRQLVRLQQKALQLVKHVQQAGAGSAGGAAGEVEEAWNNLATVIVPFRRQGWLSLLAQSLEALRQCAALRSRSSVEAICSLELSVVGRSLAHDERIRMARAALQTCLTPASPAEDRRFRVQWASMANCASACGPEGDTCVEHHGWLNIVNMSPASAESGRVPGEVVLAVALRNMLPEDASLAIPVQRVEVTAKSDLGECQVIMQQLASKGGSLAKVKLDDIALVDAHWRQVATPSDAASTAESSGGGRKPGGSAEEAVGSGGTEPGQSALIPGRWSVFCVCVQVGAAAHVAIAGVRIRLSAACVVDFALDQLYSAPPAVGPTLVCSSPTQDLEAGLVGRDAPFQAAPFKLQAGTQAVVLSHGEPTARLDLSARTSKLRVGETACCVVLVTALRAVKQGTALLLRAQAESVATGGEGEGPGRARSCVFSVGPTLDQAEPLAQDGQIKLPALKRDDEHEVKIWVLGLGVCNVAVELEVDDVEPPGERAVRQWQVTVEEPFEYAARVMSADLKTVVLRMGQRLMEGSSPHRVPVGTACMMRLLLRNMLAVPIELERLEVVLVPDTWAVQPSTGTVLVEQPYLLQPGDVYAAVLCCTPPATPGVSSVGALDVQFRWAAGASAQHRIASGGKGGGAGGVGSSGAAGADTVAVAEQAAGSDQRLFRLQHRLADMEVCSIAMTAHLVAPTTVKAGGAFQLQLCLHNMDIVGYGAAVALKLPTEVKVPAPLNQMLQLLPGNQCEYAWDVDCSDTSPSTLEFVVEVEVQAMMTTGDKTSWRLQQKSSSMQQLSALVLVSNVLLVQA